MDRVPVKILLIDDDEDMCLLFKVFTENFNCSWELAHRGDQAIELLKHNKYDVIILDYKLLAGPSGEETFRQIKRIQPKSNVAILSGFLNTILIDTISDIAPAIFIKKPTFLTYEFFEFLFNWMKIEKIK